MGIERLRGNGRGRMSDEGSNSGIGIAKIGMWLEAHIERGSERKEQGATEVYHKKSEAKESS